MKKVTILISTLLLLTVCCTIEPLGQYDYQSPENNPDGLEIGTLAEVDIDSLPVIDMVNEIYRGNYHEIHSILIHRDNKLVFEEYFHGHRYKWDGPYHHGPWVKWNANMLHGLKSVTKSITSTCIGIAIEQGFIISIHQSIFDYLPEYQHLNVEGKDEITIEHLVSMTSGLEWDEWGAPLSSAKNDVVGLWFPPCDDPINCILERPMVSKPGTDFTYSGGNMILLGEIIKNATNMNIDEFSQKYLFEPLGIDSSHWALRFNDGTIESAGGLELTPRDMTKIGVTFLNNGIWNGKQIISSQWVEKSAVPFNGNSWHNYFLRTNPPGASSIGGRNGYSCSWWTYEFYNSGKNVKLYYAGGWGGQNIIVIPELNMVVVFTGGNYVSKTKQFTILKEYILPSIK